MGVQALPSSSALGISQAVKCLMRMGSRIDLKWFVKHLWWSNKHGPCPSQCARWYFTRPLHCQHRVQSDEVPPPMVLRYIHQDFLKFCLYWIFLVASCVIGFVLAATHMTVKPLQFQAPTSSVDDVYLPNVVIHNFLLVPTLTQTNSRSVLPRKRSPSIQYRGPSSWTGIQH